MPGVRKLDLISHGLTDASRAVRFPADEPLTPVGRAMPADRAVEPPAGARIAAGPERRTRETARLLGLDAAPLSRLRDLGAGAWHGAEPGLLPPEELGRRLTDPGYRGESVLDLLDRVRGWLDEPAAGEAPRTIAVTPPAVIRAVLVVALAAAPESFWRVDVAPGARVRLPHRTAWTLRLNRPARATGCSGRP
ncbi:histidine phosphatase family protein [Nocardia fusca]|uniref:histidine phosphatase family protein n=1 Tax=Nocardia fusca TaxID=941183 RepID=UPI0007A7469E|nr:histidine phosphatase family protein [Nocardia fusca]